METCTAGCHQSSKVGGLVGQEESQKCPGVSVLKAHRHQKKKKLGSGLVKKGKAGTNSASKGKGGKTRKHYRSWCARLSVLCNSALLHEPTATEGMTKE